MDNFIVATSGFILPENNYFTPFDMDETVSDIIFNSHIVTANTNIRDFYANKDVYRSESITNAIDVYLTKKDFDSYVNLLNITLEILKEIDFMSFFKLQASNKHLSPISFNFCLDVVNGNFLINYNNYNIIPFNVRFMLNNKDAFLTFFKYIFADYY